MILANFCHLSVIKIVPEIQVIQNLPQKLRKKLKQVLGVPSSKQAAFGGTTNGTNVQKAALSW